MKWKINVSSLLLFGIMSSSAYAANLTLIYSGNLDGELEPCGCSDQGNYGGIKRRVTVLDQIRKKHPTLVAISSGGLIRAEGSSDRIKSDSILVGFKEFKYDAIAVQWPDLVYGENYLSNFELPWVASNWQGYNEKNVTKKQQGKKTIKPFQEISRRLGSETVVIDFFNWLDPEKSPLQAMQGNHTLATKDMTSVRKMLQIAKSKKHLTIVSTTFTADKLQTLLPLDLIDVVLLESAYEEFSEPKKIANTLLLTAGSRGMRIAKLDLQISQGSIKAWKHNVIAMPESIADSARMKDWYENYNAKVKQDYLRLSKLKKQQQDGESPFAGEETCQTCHSSQYKRWQTTAHADAFDDLESVGKSFDPECLLCHTVGFDKPGGFIDFVVTGNLMGVQCESCHGAARAHVKSAGLTPVKNKAWSKPQICGQCHTQPHSPGFSLDVYWPKVAH